ncbi:hypothetical protein J1N35_028701 [Gossypium stocksii]|uniref:Uncharacterized protein n=1 Tax=Gossypium stocksii TaxID=47602 RepID=A0A9D3ZS93_9ROSI|nr:hypothetical protein J1N35_028701 [Gossypium stocksii]
MATKTLDEKKSEEEEVKDKENEEGSKEEVTAKLLEFLESPHATTDVLFADKEQVDQASISEAKQGIGHYTIPKEMNEVCNWLTARLGLEG